MPKIINTAEVAKELLDHELSQTIVEGGDDKKKRIEALKYISENGEMVTLDDDVERQRKRSEYIEMARRNLAREGYEGSR